MNNLKSQYVINKEDLKSHIHIVGVGALGSQVAERLLRLGLGDKLKVYDMDVVEEINVNNQVYFQKNIGQPKVEALVDLGIMIDPENKMVGYCKEVKQIALNDESVLVLAIDNFKGRGEILSNVVTNTLVISGGISSIGGNFEITRGSDNVRKLAKEYLECGDEPEYDENDLTPCGSPISIYHRIGFAASLICDAIIKHYNDPSEIKENIMFDTPNLVILKN